MTISLSFIQDKLFEIKDHLTKKIILVNMKTISEFHRPDYGLTLGQFIAKHLPSFPPWLKIVCTVRTSSKQTCAANLPFHNIRYLTHFFVCLFVHVDYGAKYILAHFLSATADNEAFLSTSADQISISCLLLLILARFCLLI